MTTETTQIREVVVSYRGPRRTLPAAVNGPADAAAFFGRPIADAAREHFVALYLDARNCPIAYSIVSIGTATAALVHPREVFQPAIACGAIRFIVAHNHPSGQASPSREDAEVTRKLRQTGEVVGIELLDSIVIAGAQWMQVP